MPCSRCDLERLVGIGPYTASAVMAAVFGLQEPLIDVNMVRVLCRFFGTQFCDSSLRNASLYQGFSQVLRRTYLDCKSQWW
jgi:adenine-specific DNA glycosylase